MPNPNMTVTRFFGDGEQVFSLHDDKGGKYGDGLDLVRELERKFDLGCFAIFRRMYNGEQHADYTREILRLGLLGGGKTASEAHQMVSLYIDREPIGEHAGLALEVLGACLFGEDVGEEAA